MPKKCIAIFGLVVLAGTAGCARRTAPETRPAGVLTTNALPARDADLLEAVLRDRLRHADANETVFISLGSIDTNWKDPPPELLKRLSDLPYRFKPVSLARVPKPYEMESATRYRGIEDPATGKRSWIYWAEIKEWLSETKARVDVGLWSGPLGGGGSVNVFELRDGKWEVTGCEGSWVS